MILHLSIKVDAIKIFVTNYFVILSTTTSTGGDNAADQAVKLSRGSIIVVGRTSNDYTRYNQPQYHHHYIVTQLATNDRNRVIKHRNVYLFTRKSIVQAISLRDIEIIPCPITACRIDLKDVKTDVHYHIVIHKYELAASAIAEFYNARWQIELFFKWIKHILNHKSLFDTPDNTIVTQTLPVFIVNLFLFNLHYISILNIKLQQMFEPFQFNLWNGMTHLNLLSEDPSESDALNRQTTRRFSCQPLSCWDDNERKHYKPNKH